MHIKQFPFPICHSSFYTHHSKMPAFPITPLDTTGAGDVFHGAYAYALSRRAPTREAMTFASAVAALKCTRPNGRSGIPTLDASLSFWRTHS